MKIFIKTLT